MKLYESLFILTRTYDNITYLSEIMLDHNLIVKEAIEADEKKSFHYLSLFSHILLEACSFLEEYENNFTSTSEVQFKDRINELKKMARPILKQIKKWDDLRNYRNQMIAHPWRIGPSKEFSYKYLFSYNIPTSYLELQLLRQYLRIIITLIEIEFSEELKQMPFYIVSLPTRVTKKKTMLDWYADMKTVVVQVNQALAEKNRNYRLKTEAFFGSLEEEAEDLRNK